MIGIVQTQHQDRLAILLHLHGRAEARGAGSLHETVQQTVIELSIE